MQSKIGVAPRAERSVVRRLQEAAESSFACIWRSRDSNAFNLVLQLQLRCQAVCLYSSQLRYVSFVMKEHFKRTSAKFQNDMRDQY